MFGYKLEIWKYDNAQCEEAERHLYEMAEKGYEFTGVKRHMWPLLVAAVNLMNHISLNWTTWSRVF
ncbi:MAG: hypothetical protein IJN72_01990 [Firmicutes bacterium]|nr:hypothetical protein [Bacillota bacterium]